MAKRSMVRAVCLVALLVLARSSSISQPPVAAAVALTVNGVCDKPVTLTLADLDKLPQQSIKVTDHSGQEAAYGGPSLGDVMKRAGLDFQSNLHGRSLTRFLLVEAADKYRIVFSLPEFDPAFTDRVILLATTHDGKPISNEEGPFRIIVPDDKRPARWVRQVRLLSILDSVKPSEQNKKP